VRSCSLPTTSGWPSIDQLVDAGTPVDAFDEVWGRQALRIAAENGRPASVRRLLERGADPNLRDREGRTALDWCRAGTRPVRSSGHEQVDAILRPLTAD
jgi:ankyrin repeat protein